MATTDPDRAAAMSEPMLRLLREMLIEHEQLLSLAALHRDAIARADGGAIGACLKQQNAIVQRIGELEKRRLALMGRYSEQMGNVREGEADGTGKGGGGDMRSMAGALPEADRSRVMAMADRLRGLIERVQREHRAIRSASETLAEHMRGLIQQVRGRLSCAGTYGRGGAVEAGGRVYTSVDVTL